MRLWHKDLIPVLPRQQLLGQWRECCAIAKSIVEKGTPNHILVNRIMDYKITSFATYCSLIVDEMKKREYNVSESSMSKLEDYLFEWSCNEMKPQIFRLLSDKKVDNDELFSGWHNDSYLRQCYFNLQEKYDCGGISAEEWDKIVKRFYHVERW